MKFCKRLTIFGFLAFFSAAPVQAITISLQDENPLDGTGALLQVEERGFLATGRIGLQTFIEDVEYNYIFEVENKSTDRLFVGTYFSCGFCRGIETISFQGFTNYGPKRAIDPLSSIFFSISFTNPNKDSFGRTPSIQYAVQEAPIPATIFLFLASLGGMGILHIRQKRLPKELV